LDDDVYFEVNRKSEGRYIWIMDESETSRSIKISEITVTGQVTALALKQEFLPQNYLDKFPQAQALITRWESIESLIDNELLPKSQQIREDLKLLRLGVTTLNNIAYKAANTCNTIKSTRTVLKKIPQIGPLRNVRSRLLIMSQGPFISCGSVVDRAEKKIAKVLSRLNILLAATEQSLKAAESVLVKVKQRNDYRQQVLVDGIYSRHFIGVIETVSAITKANHYISATTMY